MEQQQQQDDPVVWNLLDRAAALPPDRRAAFLDAACAGDAERRARVEALLAGAGGGEPWPQGLTADAAARVQGEASRPAVEAAGNLVAGRYKLLERIGAGGMGEVWAAEQTQPVRRRVALKLIKAGMDSGSVLARFEAERQALAVMDHASIAKVLDGGSTERGRPFFVMEYVKGIPITQYCDDARLSVRERLDLFTPVCQAVQHAHQKGIIHRDLKPSNILVCLYDGQPVPKVIDFGLAKAVHGQPLSEQTLYTAHGVTMGTPMYMSPEQANWNNLDIDTRSDVYSLGVVLYELLSGSTPLEKQRFKEAAWHEMLRLIKEEEPPKPSTRLSGSATLPSIAARRKLEPAQLPRLVRGDLDRIVMKALEKERGRRYESAGAFAEDVQRYLREEPVRACPPSAGYRLRKFVRRNRGSVAAAAAVVVALVLGLGAASYGFVRATRLSGRLATALDETDRQKQEAQRQQRGAEVALAAGMLSEADALDLAGRWGDADARYREAFAAFDRLGQSTLPVEFSMLSHYAASPPPLVTCRSGMQVRAVALSPDGRTAFTAGVDSARRYIVQTWDLPTGREVHATPVSGEGDVAHTWAIAAVAWSPDARVVISGGARTLHAVDMRGGKALWTVPSGSPVMNVAYSADGARFVVLRSDGIVELRDARTGGTVHEFQGPGQADNQFVLAVRPCLDGRHVLSAARGGSLTLRDLGDGRTVRSFAGHKGMVHAMDVAPDGRTAVTASTTADKTVRVWDLRTGAELQVVAMPAGVAAVTISPDGRTVACGGLDGVVTVLDLTTAKPPLAVFRGHAATIGRVAFSRDGRFVLSGGDDKTVKLWDVRSADEPRPLSVPRVIRVALSPDGRTAASADADRTVRLWDLRTGSNLRTFRRPEAAFGGLAFSPDGRTLAAAGTDGIVKLWDARTGKAVLTLCGHPGAPAAKARKMPVAFSPDGATLLSGGFDGPLKLWDLKTGAEVRALRGHTANVTAVALSPDGRSALSAADDNTVRLWDVQTGAERRSFARGATAPSCVRFSADGLLAVTGEFGGGARVLDLQSGQARLSLELDSSVADACLSPGGALLLIACWEGGGVRTFDARTGREGRALAAHLGSINDMACSGDATSLLTSSGQDGAVRRWDLRRPREHVRLAARAEAALQRLAHDAGDAAALAHLGEWYAFRGADDWAVEMLEKARAGGAAVPPQVLADCYTRLQHGTVAGDEGGGGAADARYADKAAAALREALAASADPAERAYLQLRLDALLDAPDRLRREAGRKAAADLAGEATALADRGEFREAAAAFARAREADGDDLWHWFHEGCLLAYLRDEPAYEKHCKAMLARFADPADTSPAVLTDATTADRVAKTCLLLPGVGGDVRQLSALADRVTNARFASQYARWFVLVDGMAEYRRGDFQAAADTLGGRRDMLPLAAAEAAVELYLAMALHRLGRSDDARAAMSRATELVERSVPRVGGPGLSGLDTWLTCHIARREAEELMGTAGGTTDPTTQKATEPSNSTAR